MAASRCLQLNTAARLQLLQQEKQRQNDAGITAGEWQSWCSGTVRKGWWNKMKNWRIKRGENKRVTWERGTRRKKTKI
jgi:hypothetical protein